MSIPIASGTGFTQTLSCQSYHEAVRTLEIVLRDTLRILHPTGPAPVEGRFGN
jgi:hypothetical protein